MLSIFAGLERIIGVDFFGQGHYPACLLMYLKQFHQKSGDTVHIEPEQGSRFAKEIAGDFNPLHNPDNKRFCVPGDLLFSLVLANYGLSPRMSFRFKAMVGKGTELLFPVNDDKAFDISDSSSKCYMEVERDGKAIMDADKVEMLSRSYVAFSGKTFPTILVPLLEEQQTMINPDRPLVIYERMHFELTRVDFNHLDLRLHKASLDAKGKRGAVALDFTIYDGEEEIGSGRKQLLISGLMPYDPVKVKGLTATYDQWKADYESREPFSASPVSGSV